MRTLAQSLLLCLVLGCTGSVSHPKLAWQFDVQLDGRDQPHGKVWLAVDGERHLITDDPIVGYRIVARSDYERRQIPNRAVLACTAWWAGLGEDMYVTADADQVQVFRREFGETVPTIPPFSVFKTISLHRRANPRSALDARMALCLHLEAHWPGSSESER